MEDGYIYSGQTIQWYYNRDSRFRKMMGAGRALKSEWMLSGCKKPGFICPSCKIVCITDVEC